MISLFRRFQKLWDLSVPVDDINRIESELVPVESKLELTESLEPFVVFSCSECGIEVMIEDPVPPGNIGVVACTCGIKWAVHVPRLIIRKVEDQPLIQPFIKEIAKEFSVS